MKRNLQKTLLTIACLFCSFGVYAHDFEVDGIYYNIIDSIEKTVEVTYSLSNIVDNPNNYPTDPEGDGSENNPYNVSAAMANQNGALAWVKGFVVGHVASSSINESQFEAPFTGAVYDDGSVATQGTNILISASPTENDPSACFVVQLPKGDVRSALELVNNPDNDGKPVELYGKLTKYFGVAGMKETSVAKIHGQTIGQGGGSTTDPDTPADPEVGEGNGTKANPYNVAAVISLNNSGAKAWVKAYIIGQINGKSISNVEWEAPFGIAEDSTHGTNVVIADNVDDKDNIVPVQLTSGAVRNALSLPDHPELDGKEVLLYGELVKYFGTCGIKNTTCAIIDGAVYGVDPSDEPVDNSEAILSISFTAGLGDFTAYSVSGDQVWMSDKTYGAKMSGYANSASHANEDWLISPALDLGGKSGVSISYEHAINKGDLNNLMTNHTMWMSDNYNGGDPTTATWTQVEIVAYPDGKSWTYVPSGAIAVPAEYLKSNVRFAFKYLCSDKESATWEVRNLELYNYGKVYKKKATVSQTSIDTLSIPSNVTYNGNTYRVISIGNDAFSGCTGLTKIIIPNSVVSIGSYAFYNCI